MVKKNYFWISYDNPCSPLSFSPLPAPCSLLQAHVLALLLCCRLARYRVVTLDVFRENHVRRTSFGRTSESADRRRTTNPSSRWQGQTALGGWPKRTAPTRWPVLRQSAQPPYSKTAKNIYFHSLNSFIRIQVLEL
jgi:hypothetical protein